MLKSIVSSAALALGIALPATAAAQGAPSGGACPPGSWFCAQDPQQQPPPGPGGQAAAAAARPGRRRTPPRPRRRREPGAAPPPVVVYQPPPPVMVVRPEAPPPYEYAPPPPRVPSPSPRVGPQPAPRRARPSATAAGSAPMGGGGLGFASSPPATSASRPTVDFVGGHDYQGDDRNETAFTFNALFFLNPQSRAQLYLLAGFGWSGAHVTSDTSALDDALRLLRRAGGRRARVRLTRVFALDVDLRGFVRGRTDPLAQTQPEFTNADGRRRTRRAAASSPPG